MMRESMCSGCCGLIVPQAGGVAEIDWVGPGSQLAGQNGCPEESHITGQVVCPHQGDAIGCRKGSPCSGPPRFLGEAKSRSLGAPQTVFRLAQQGTRQFRSTSALSPGRCVRKYTQTASR